MKLILLNFLRQVEKAPSPLVWSLDYDPKGPRTSGSFRGQRSAVKLEAGPPCALKGLSGILKSCGDSVSVFVCSQ